MSTIHLIRHGRASAADTDYDQLHPQGEEQSRLLGRFLHDRGRHFDAVYCGPLKRQVDTLRLMREAALRVGEGWPPGITLDGLAEAPLETLMKTCLVERLGKDPVIDEVAQGFSEAHDRESRRPVIERAFDHMVKLWRRGEVTRDDLETAESFDTRVCAALDRIVQEQGRGKQVAVITSNGVIGRLVEYVHDPTRPSESYLIKFANTSRTLIEVTQHGTHVAEQNLIDHLPDPRLVTLL